MVLPTKGGGVGTLVLSTRLPGDHRAEVPHTTLHVKTLSSAATLSADTPRVKQGVFIVPKADLPRLLGSASGGKLAENLNHILKRI